MSFKKDKETLKELKKQYHKELQDLRRLAREGQLMFFIGAGLSQGLGLPGWGSFLIKAAQSSQARQDIKDMIEAQDFIGAAGRLEQDLSASGLTQEIAKTFGDEEIQGKDAGDPLALLPQFLEGPVVTTNFDRILESVFSAAGKPFKRIYVGAAMKGATSALLENEHVLIKLHGTWSGQVNRVLTPNEYKLHYGGTQLEELVITRSLPFLVLELFMMRRVLFIGCGLASDLIMAVGDLIKEKTKVSKHFCFFAMPDSTPKAEETQEQADKRAQDEQAENQERFERSGIKPIWFPAHRYEFISDLLRAIQPPLGLSQKAQSFFSWFGTLTLLVSLTFIVP
ncbi:MAG: SIR2 family protein, partial [Verrucomicrobia bacterium]|nr:SIR2 family protein [Verrucomicrobiota bacterium]